MVKRERRVANGKVHSILHIISCRFHQRSWFSQNFLKCDNEPGTKALQDAVIQACVEVEVIPQGPTEGDHMANGRVEMAVREVKRQCRTLRISAEHNTGVRISDDSPLLGWLPCFAAQVMNKMRIGKDGKTSELRRTGRRWRKPMAHFGEKVWFRKIGKDGVSSFASRMAQQELQNEINFMNDSRDFQDAESVRSGHSHVTSQPVSFPPHPSPEGMLSRSFGMPSRRAGPPSIWDTHGILGNVFANPAASSTAPFPQEWNPWSSGRVETIHLSTAEKNENQTPVQDQRCQSVPSAKSSVIPSEGDSFKNYGADQQRLQISDVHFDKFTTPATFACWKIRFKIEVCTCSQFPTEAMQWIKEVELVDSVDD